MKNIPYFAGRKCSLQGKTSGQGKKWYTPRNKNNWG